MLAENPYQGLKVYFSGSIRGVPEPDPEFAWQLVQFMASGGADVLSEHVAARSQQEMDSIRARRIGLTIQEMLADPEPWFLIREQDIDWVDEATHVVALVNAPSHGVGMEIQRALDKPAMGMNRTPILALIHENLLEPMSRMVRGVRPTKHPEYFLKTYQSLTDAQTATDQFLRGILKR